jgi:hypothetical protein
MFIVLYRYDLIVLIDLSSGWLLVQNNPHLIICSSNILDTPDKYRAKSTRVKPDNHLNTLKNQKIVEPGSFFGD